MTGLVNITQNTYAAGGSLSTTTQERGPFEVLVEDVSAITGTSYTATCNNVNAVLTAIVQSIDSGGNIGTTDADVTVSGNTITVADGSTFDLSAEDTLVIIAIGKDA